MLFTARSSQKGFTLIEIIITLALVSIVFATVSQNLDPRKLFNSGNDARRKSDLATMRSALESYKLDKGDYPLSLSTCVSFTNSALASALTPRYIRTIPSDPKYLTATASASTGNNYLYFKTGTGDYYLYAVLEGSSPNPGIIAADGAVCGVSGTALYNYRVSSP